MIKNIIMTVLFVSWGIAGMETLTSVSARMGTLTLICAGDGSAANPPVARCEPNGPIPERTELKPGYIELDCTMGVYKACKGRSYEKETSYNIVSRHDQKLWTFHDPALETVVVPFRDPLIYEEYDTLKVHTCLVNIKSPGTYFTTSFKPSPHTLITKFEFNPQTWLLRRTLETFLLQLILAKEIRIYAWVNKKEKGLLDLLIKYGFQESQEALYIPPTITRRVFCIESGMLQLQADVQDICHALS
jgi:hypothetical protein